MEMENQCTPYLSVDLKKLEENVKKMTSLCKAQGVSVIGVTKGFLANPRMAKTYLQGGVEMLGDSRLLNLKRLRENGFSCPLVLMRSPHLSEVDAAVELSDISLNSELVVLEALSQAALKKGKVHEVLIMADMGDLREGLWPDELEGVLKKAKDLKGISIRGLGMNLTDLNGVLPTEENHRQFMELVEEMETKLGYSFSLLSAGNSSSIPLLKAGVLPKRINSFRLGESLLLGRETAYGEYLEGWNTDVFSLTAEIIECKEKPSVPLGEIGVDAFGNTPVFTDKGRMRRGILNLGRQDVNPDGLILLDENIEILGATSDHMILDLTKRPDLKVGDTVSFGVRYGGMLNAMTSPFVKKVFKD